MIGFDEPVFLGGCPVIKPHDGIYVEGQRVITLAGVGVGAIERRNPLPPGRYWIDLFEKDGAAWFGWRARNSESVKIETTEHFNAIDGYPSRDFIIFKVLSPVEWEGPGYPSIADPAVKDSSDTTQRPDPIKDPLDTVTDWIYSPSGKSTVSWFALAAGGALIVYIIANSTSHRAARA